MSRLHYQRRSTPAGTALLPLPDAWRACDLPPTHRQVSRGWNIAGYRSAVESVVAVAEWLGHEDATLCSPPTGIRWPIVRTVCARPSALATDLSGLPCPHRIPKIRRNAVISRNRAQLTVVEGLPTRSAPSIPVTAVGHGNSSARARAAARRAGSGASSSRVAAAAKAGA